ncbi:uncharacterized protein EDB93DRAFT_1251271 [Suillus bovinus]|uniref:uncharacterized protein n=1 Tax=Suillus bovinus TaxID=48563 RepID=UPI001B8780F2|nr:uncharacterized protein EDB93DRAFT_1251271 [Suillus bovinus]KAG2145403.1 hypothetical protein EDB93DRAFT_1251271 [Suillus bovinus]
MPYRPYVPFTTSTSHEGRHSGHTPCHVLQSNKSPSDSTFASSPYRSTRSLSHDATPFEHPLSPIPMSPVTTTHLDAPAAITIPEESMDNESLITANDDIAMDQDMSSAAPPFSLNCSPPAHHPPTITPPQQRHLPFLPALGHYLGQLLHDQFAELSDKVVAPALRNAVNTMMPAMIEQIAGKIRGITSTCSHKICSQKHSGAVVEDTKPECEDNLMPSSCRKHPGKQGTMNHLHACPVNFV